MTKNNQIKATIYMLSLFYEHQINEKVKKQVTKTMAIIFS